MIAKGLLVLATFIAIACSSHGWIYKQPTIMVVLLARNKEHTLPNFLTLFQQLDYPKKRMSLYIRADHCQDNTIPILQTWVAAERNNYHSVNIVFDRNSTLYPGEESITQKIDVSYEGIIKLKEAALNAARSRWADYVWFLDMDVFITEPDLLNLLIEEREPIVAPMLNSLGRYTNFWGGMSEQYWYVRTDEYMNILDRKETGCFSVPMVHSCVLVNLKVAETDRLTFNPDLLNIDDLPLDDIITFGVSARQAGLELTVCNDAIYGYVSPPVIESEKPHLDILRHKSLLLEVIAYQEPLPVSPLLQKYVPPPPSKDKLGFDEIYLINLRRRQERKMRMERSFTELGLNVTAIEAVDGKNLTQEQLAGIKYFPGYTDPWSGRQMTYGEIGCFMSHYKVWSDVVEKGYDKILLFEDDIRFEPFFREHMVNLMAHVEQINLDWDLIYIGRKKLHNSDEPWVDDSDKLVHVDYSYWTLCYILSGRGAAKLLAAKPLEKILPVDEFLPIMFNKHPQKEWSAAYPIRDVKAYSVAPLLVFPTHYTGEEGYISDTEESNLLDAASKDVNGTTHGRNESVERCDGAGCQHKGMPAADNRPHIHLPKDEL